MYNVKNKKVNITNMNSAMLNKTLSMFEYSNLPDSMPAKEIEKGLQMNGYIFVTEFEGVIYPLHGTLGGDLDVYGNFTKIVIANSALNLFKTLDINNDGVLISNDDLLIGLLPMFDKANSLLCENDININMWGMASRSQKMISASDDKTRESAALYLKKMEEGEFSIIGEKPFIDSLKVHSPKSLGGIKVSEFLELNQYIKASLLNEIGLSSNFNMKKERLITSEVEQGEDSIFPLVYSMMKNRIEGFKKVNEKYSLNIDVDFGSVWALKNKKLVDGIIDNEIDVNLTGVTDDVVEGEVTLDDNVDEVTIDEEVTQNDEDVIQNDEQVDEVTIDEEVTQNASK